MSNCTTPSILIRGRINAGRGRFLTFAAAALLGLGAAGAQAANRWWDNSAGANNGVGGSGTWGATFSTTANGDAALTTAGTGDDLFFEGTAGVITLSGSQIANSLSFNATGYKITASSSSTRTIAGPIALASNINLTVGNGETTDIRVGLGNVSGSIGSTVTINGAATGNAVTRLDLSTGNTPTVSVPITITGSGFANIAGGAPGSQVTGTVTGNGARLNLGATSGNAITFTQSITNGTAAVRIAAGSNGGAGVVTLSGTANTWGATELNNAASGIVRMGVVNALPVATTLTFGVTASNGDSIVELNGKDTTIGQLTSGVQTGGVLRNTSGAAAKLTISGSDTSAAAFTGSIQDGVGGGALSVVRGGTGTTIFSAANTFTGSTTISGGTVLAADTVASTTVSASSVTATIATDVITLSGNPLVDGNKVIFGGTTVPTGLTAGTVYFVRDTSGTTFKVAATLGGAAIDLTGTGTAVTVTRPGALGSTNTAIVLGDAATTTNGSSPSFLTSGAIIVERPITVASQTTTGTYTIGGSTADSSTFSGALALNRNVSLTAATGGTVNLTGAIANASGTNTVKVDAVGTGKVVLNSGTSNAFAPTAINVANGTLLLGAANQIGNSTSVAVGAGATFATGGFSEGTSAASQTAQLGALILNGNSTLDFKTGANGSSLLFSGLTYNPGDTVSITNWSGSLSADNGTASNDRLLFVTDPGFSAAQLAAIQFKDDTGALLGAGAAEISFHGYFELVPIPEPATIFGALGLVGLVVFRERRRWRSLLARRAPQMRV